MQAKASLALGVGLAMVILHIHSSRSGEQHALTDPTDCVA